VLVDNKFDDFISAIKGDLSMKLKEKEMTMDKKVEEDLSSRKRDFEMRYKDLVRRVNEKYRKRVSMQLAREVQERFSAELNEKLEEEKKKIIISLIQENVRRLHVERQKMAEGLEEKYKKKEQVLQEAIDKDVITQRSVIKVQRDKLAAKRVKIHNAIQAVEAREKVVQEMGDRLSKRDKDLKESLARKDKNLGKRERGLDSKKRELEEKDKQMQEILKKETGALRQKLVEGKASVSKERAKLHQELDKLKRQEERDAGVQKKKEGALINRQDNVEKKLLKEKLEV
jgi:hypothetical protein